MTEVYMCKTDYDHHLGMDAYGTMTYASIDSLIENRKCISECGIVKVKVELVEVIQDRADGL